MEILKFRRNLFLGLALFFLVVLVPIVDEGRWMLILPLLGLFGLFAVLGLRVEFKIIRWEENDSRMNY